MKGVNKITLNNGTIVEAIQEYFDRRTVNSSLGEVTNIEPVYDGTLQLFKVTLSARPEKSNVTH